jgi:ABC-type nitrate/sulfonate/bicarbonate transport system substrate-binding protein
VRVANTLMTAIIVAVVLTACGGDDDSGGQPGEAKVTKVRVGVLPVTGMAPLYLGMKKGFFRAEGLEIEPVVGQGGAAIVPAVISNDFQFGFGNNISLMIARAKGLPIRIVAEGNQAGADEATSLNGLLASRKSGIRSVKDLAGKTVAVTTLNNLAEVTVKATLEKHGASTDGLKFVELPFPEMNAAVQRGRADVAWQGEPFVTLGVEAGLRKIADPMIETMPSLSIATWFGADPYLNGHPEVVQGFTRAMDRSYEYAMAHLDEARAIVPSFLKMPPDVLAKVELNRWTSELNVKSLELTKRLGLEYGLIEQDFDLKDLLPKDAS